MKYIDTIKFPSFEEVENHMATTNLSLYPWTIFFNNEFEWMNLKDITILYGNNGSGKSTILNLISEKIKAQRFNELFNDTYITERGKELHPFHDFLETINIKMVKDEYDEDLLMPKTRKLITSEDIFNKIDNRKKHNEIAIRKIKEARSESFNYKYKDVEFSLDNFDEYAKHIEARKITVSKYARLHAPKTETLESNGETSIAYFEYMFESGGIYLLDEPENCLSPIFQMRLVNFIKEASLYYNCQFIIATHSPIILSIEDALIYNLDEIPVISEKWEELENIKLYFDFFYKRKDKFNK